MTSRTPLIYCHVDDRSEAGHDALPLLLSDRQREILNLAAQGLPSHEIGRTLGISKQTVRNHLQKAREAYSLKTTIQLAVIAAKQNII